VNGTIRADTIFVCAGAIQTPALLRRSGIRRNVGDTLCIHPMIKAAALFDEEIEAGDAALPMYQVNEFWPTMTLGGSVCSPGFLAMLLADNWAVNRDLMRFHDRMGLYYAATRGMSRGRIRTIPGMDDGTLVRYRLSEADRRNLSIGLARLSELLFAAGAKAVYPSLRDFPTLTSVDAARGFLKRPLPASTMNLSTVHVFSTCPMGENTSFCATDSYGKVLGCSNLFVNDASLLPDSPGVNPQGTTMAIALRNAERFSEVARSAPRVLRKAQLAPGRKTGVLVTGAPGWLGTRLVEVLRDPELRRRCGFQADIEANAIRCLVQPGTDPGPLGGRENVVEVCFGDLGDDEVLGRFCSYAEGSTLFHVAGVVHPAWRTRDFMRVNVEGTRRLLEAAQVAGVRRIVVVSSNSPIGSNPHAEHLFDENSPYHPYMNYGRSKVRMERLVHEAQATGRIETVIVRPPWFYGPHQPPRQTQFFRLIKQGRFPVLGSGLQKRSMAFVDNICQGLLLAATVEQAKGRTYWIADAHPYTIEEIVSTVRDVLQERFGIPCASRGLHLPSWLGSSARWVDATLQGLGLYQQQVHVLGELNQTIACSIERARAELGYAPRYSLRDGMTLSIQWCLENGHYI
jgi:nucleoside-diphosphate-sugar epimerase